MRIKGITKKEFKSKLLAHTGCRIQHTGWTCGTCFFSISEEFSNNDWNAVLFFRGDSSLEELNKYRKEDGREILTLEMIEQSIKKIWGIIK